MARTKLVVALALASVIISPLAGALGLGAIEIKSALNQPLDARIALLPADEHELESLTVKLASAEAFRRAGVDRPFFLTRLKFDIVSGNTPYVRVFTEQPVKEPFLDFLVEADWARGRLVREFTLLLDPPVFGGAGVVAPRVASAPADRTTQAEQAASQTSSFTASAGAATPSTQTASTAVGSQYGPVSANDTLWKIAQKVRPDSSLSLNQTMVALLHANPDAFIDGDMNRLKRGSVLTVPDGATIGAIGRAEADQEARSHMQRWRQQAAATPPSGRLQVVAPEQAGVSDSAEEQEPSTQATAEELQRELMTFRENSLSLEAENADLKAQVEALKQEVSQYERLINLSADSPAGLAGSDAIEEPAIDEPVAEDAEAFVADADPKAEESEAVVEEVPEPSQAKPASLPVSAPAEAANFWDDPRNLGMLGGVALVLLSLIFLIVRRRRATSSGLPDTEMPVFANLPEEEPELGANLGLEAESEDELIVGETDASDGLDELAEDDDALSESELYLAYGRYDQAREVLDKALQEEPEHTGLRLKLLQTLALLQEEEGFIENARILRDQAGENDEAWQQALDMGREFLPADPLFADSDADGMDMQPELESATGSQSTEILEEEEWAPLAAVSSPVEPEEAEQDFSLDFDLPEAEPEQALDDSDSEAEFPVQEDSSYRVDKEPELGLTDTAPLEELPGVELSDLQLGDLALDEDDNVLEFSQADATIDAVDDQLDELDEVGVKLNLARAYVDLGDNDGARSLLDEVVAEGSSQQKEEAEDLLGQLA